MNYIKHLAGFFDRVAADERLNPTHVSMYVSLFPFWNASRFQNPISISRNELMKVSKISAKATYHKCMRELNDFGYLKYMPSYNPFKGSLVHLFNFQIGSEQPPDTHHTKTVQVVNKQPYINSSNIINQTELNLGKPTQKKEVQKLNGLGKEEKEKLRQKKKNVILSDSEGTAKFKLPELSEVQKYFLHKNIHRWKLISFITISKAMAGWLEEELK